MGIDAAWQKLDCTFLTNVPNLGHLDGGEEQDVCPAAQTPNKHRMTRRFARRLFHRLRCNCHIGSQLLCW